LFISRRGVLNALAVCTRCKGEGGGGVGGRRRGGGGVGGGGGGGRRRGEEEEEEEKEKEKEKEEEEDNSSEQNVSLLLQDEEGVGNEQVKAVRVHTSVSCVVLCVHTYQLSWSVAVIRWTLRAHVTVWKVKGGKVRKRRRRRRRGGKGQEEEEEDASFAYLHNLMSSHRFTDIHKNILGIYICSHTLNSNIFGIYICSHTLNPWMGRNKFVNFFWVISCVETRSYINLFMFDNNTHYWPVH
jgi:hypothetical protein